MANVMVHCNNSGDVSSSLTKTRAKINLEKTTQNIVKPKPLLYARVAGFLYLVLLPLGVFGIMYGPAVLVVPEDATTTASNIIASETLFRLSIITNLILHIVSILLVLALYKLLKPVNKNHAVLMVIFLLVGIPIAMLNLLSQFAALQLLSSEHFLTVFTSE
jgi:uncharacterized membrane protein